ncbi:MAG TPA: hypothetical protein VFP98_03160, partial [Candidatus Polarisedimenticolia bacterium]|nr:hypothetical protein [Candidatus Polarisedimenticolia bacterium]
IGLYETWLAQDRGIGPEILAGIEETVTRQVEEAAEAALAGRRAAAATEQDVLTGVFALHPAPDAH